MSNATRSKHRKLSAAAPVMERMVNDDAKLLEGLSIGNTCHQGDIIIVPISRLPSSARRRANRQLAEGDTQGSRHVLQRGEIYDAPATETAWLVREATGCIVGEQYIGPVFVSPEDPTADDLTHPEHGNQGFPAGMVCAVVYQRNLDAEEREQRTRD